MSQTKKLQLMQLVWALQEFGVRNREMVPDSSSRNLCAYCERNTPSGAVFRLRLILASSALEITLCARSWVNRTECSL